MTEAKSYSLSGMCQSVVCHYNEILEITYKEKRFIFSSQFWSFHSQSGWSHGFGPLMCMSGDNGKKACQDKPHGQEVIRKRNQSGTHIFFKGVSSVT